MQVAGAGGNNSGYKSLHRRPHSAGSDAKASPIEELGVKISPVYHRRVVAMDSVPIRFFRYTWTVYCMQVTKHQHRGGGMLDDD